MEEAGPSTTVVVVVGTNSAHAPPEEVVSRPVSEEHPYLNLLFMLTLGLVWAFVGGLLEITAGYRDLWFDEAVVGPSILIAVGVNNAWIGTVFTFAFWNRLANPQARKKCVRWVLAMWIISPVTYSLFALILGINHPLMTQLSYVEIFCLTIPTVLYTIRRLNDSGMRIRMREIFRALAVALVAPALAAAVVHFILVPTWERSHNSRLLIRLFLLPLTYALCFRLIHLLLKVFDPCPQLAFFFLFPKSSAAATGRIINGGGENLGSAMSTLVVAELADLVIRATYIHRQALKKKLINMMKRKKEPVDWDAILLDPRTIMFIVITTLEIFIEIIAGVVVPIARVALGQTPQQDIVMGVSGVCLDFLLAAALVWLWRRQGMRVEWMAAWDYLTGTTLTIAAVSVVSFIYIVIWINDREFGIFTISG